MAVRNSNKTLRIRFYEELNDFLPEAKRKKIYDLSFTGRQTVKDIIESEGIPHTGVDLIIIDGESVGFQYLVNSGDFVSVYPTFETLDISPINKLREEPLRGVKFVLDVHLGKLARYLRILGLDAKYETNYDDATIADIADKEKRIVLTRDVGLLKRNKVKMGHWLREQDPKKQAIETIKKFDLYKFINPFTVCPVCNSKLKRIEKEKIEYRLEPKTKKYYERFFICENCDKVYWRGGHWQRMNKEIESILSGEV